MPAFYKAWYNQASIAFGSTDYLATYNAWMELPLDEFDLHMYALNANAERQKQAQKDLERRIREEARNQ